MDLRIEVSPAYVDNAHLKQADKHACLVVGPFGANPSASANARCVREAAQQCKYAGKITIITHDKEAKPEDVCELIRTRLGEVYYDNILLYGQIAHKAVFGEYYPALDVRGGHGYLHPDSTVKCHLLPDPFHVSRNRFRYRWIVADTAAGMTAGPGVQLSGTAVRQSDDTVETLCIYKDTVFDCETFGHQNNAEFRILSMAASNVGGSTVVYWTEEDLVPGSDGWNRARRYLQQCVLSGHNRKYDLYSILAYFQIYTAPDCAGDDTYIIARLLRSDTIANLEAQAGRLGVVGHKARAERHKHQAELAIDAARGARTKQVVVSTKKELRTLATGRKQNRTVPDVIRPPTATEADAQALAAVEKYKLKHPSSLCGSDADWIMASKRGDSAGAYAYAFVDPYERDLYCCLDVLTTSFLLILHRDELANEPDINAVYQSVIRYAPRAFVHIENAGLHVDMERLEEFSKFIDARLKELYEELKQYGIPEGFNPGSSDQVGEFLFEKLKLPCGKKTKTGKYSTGKLALKPLLDKHPVIKLLSEYSELEKLQSNYADGLRPFIRDDSRIHAVFNLVGAATGRASCNDPNMQTIPSRGQYAKLAKALYRAPKGKCFLVFDYKTIEPMKAAELSNDKAMLEAFIKGEDFHRRTGKFISQAVWGNPFDTCGLDETDPEFEAKLAVEQKRRRVIAKEIGLATLYGQGVDSMAERAGCTVEEAEMAHVALLGSYKELGAWIKRCISQSAQTGVTWTYWKGRKARRRYVLDIGSTDSAEKSHGERTSYNTPVQGSAHEHLLAAACEIVQWLEANGYETKLVLCVHDALYFEVPDDEVDEVGPVIMATMCRHSSDILKLVVEAEKGNRLSELQPWTPTAN